MKHDEILLRTLDDLRLSSSERQVLTALLAEQRDEPDLLPFASLGLQPSTPCCLT